MRIFLFILSIFITSCGAQNVDNCHSLNKTIELILKDKRILNYFHPELKERIPYTFSSAMQCTGNYLNYTIIASNNNEEDTVIKIIRFEVSGQKISIALYYPLEGLEVNAVIINKDEIYRISDLKFFEK